MSAARDRDAQRPLPPKGLAFARGLFAFGARADRGGKDAAWANVGDLCRVPGQDGLHRRMNPPFAALGPDAFRVEAYRDSPK